jgi:hypothetical protein
MARWGLAHSAESPEQNVPVPFLCALNSAVILSEAKNLALGNADSSVAEPPSE